MTLSARINLDFPHRVTFTRDVLNPANPVLADTVRSEVGPGRVLAFVDTHVAHAMPQIPAALRAYAAVHADSIQLAGRVRPVIGGEACKNDRDAMYRVLEAMDAAKIDRHSYVLVIGGGAVLDCVGFAAAIAHRGVRLIRMPTTTLAQADSGVGVKNGINGFGKKNFLGSFAVPWAVINDDAFLATLPDREWRCGFVEAVKVALVKDADFFARIESSTASVVRRDLPDAMPIVQRSAELHLAHIAHGGDPFELTSARPLDFGHWAAHKLEAMTDFDLRHGEAVAIGIALDAMYSHLAGMLDAAALQRIVACLRSLGLALWHDALGRTDELLAGLDEFREHLGGQLTITLLTDIGRGEDVHRIDRDLMLAAIARLEPLASSAAVG